MNRKLNLIILASLVTASFATADEVAGATGYRSLFNTTITYGNLTSLWNDDAWRMNARWTGGGGSSDVRVQIEFDFYNPLLAWKSYRRVSVEWNGSADSRSLNKIFLLDRDGNYRKVAENRVNSTETTFSTQATQPNKFILPGGGVKMKMDLTMTRQSLFRLDMVRVRFID